MNPLRSKSARAVRRAFPIHGYIGPNGGGKSTAMAWDSIPSLLAGRQILSTVRLLDFQEPRLCDDPLCTALDHDSHMAAHPLWVPFTDWRQLLDAEHCDVLMDEVTGVASSRESHSMPSQVANFLVQLRRRDVVLRWTAPNWARADVIIRECSQAATLCTGYLPKRVPVGPGEEERQWRHRRLFKWQTYDAALLDDLTAGKRETLKAWKFDLHWGPGSPAFDVFDTFDAVLGIGTVSEHGACMQCGGSRRRPACSCPKPEPVALLRLGGEGRAPLAGAPTAPAESDPQRSPRVAVASESPTPTGAVLA